MHLHPKKRKKKKEKAIFISVAVFFFFLKKKRKKEKEEEEEEMTSFNNVISILGNCSCCCNLKRPKAYSFDEKDLNDTEQNIRNKKRRNVSLKLQLRSSRSHRQYD